jgi:circadian clock protein KaiC
MSKKVATGISGLDELVGGGFPEGRVILVIGGPGTGKTIFAASSCIKESMKIKKVEFSSA